MAFKRSKWSAGQEKTKDTTFSWNRDTVVCCHRYCRTAAPHSRWKLTSDDQKCTPRSQLQVPKVKSDRYKSPQSFLTPGIFCSPTDIYVVHSGPQLWASSSQHYVFSLGQELHRNGPPNAEEWASWKVPSSLVSQFCHHVTEHQKLGTYMVYC